MLYLLSDELILQKIHKEGALPNAFVTVVRLSSELSFKTSFENCILKALEQRQWRKTPNDDWSIYWCEKEFIPETLDRNRMSTNLKVNHFRNYYEVPLSHRI